MLLNNIVSKKAYLCRSFLDPPPARGATLRNYTIPGKNRNILRNFTRKKIKINKRGMRSSLICLTCERWDKDVLALDSFRSNVPRHLHKDKINQPSIKISKFDFWHINHIFVLLSSQLCNFAIISSRKFVVLKGFHLFESIRAFSQYFPWIRPKNKSWFTKKQSLFSVRI